MGWPLPIGQPPWLSVGWNEEKKRFLWCFSNSNCDILMKETFHQADLSTGMWSDKRLVAEYLGKHVSHNFEEVKMSSSVLIWWYLISNFKGLTLIKDKWRNARTWYLVFSLKGVLGLEPRPRGLPTWCESESDKSSHLVCNVKVKVIRSCCLHKVKVGGRRRKKKLWKD